LKCRLIAVLILLASCHVPPPSFQDVLDGRVNLDAEEIEILNKLLGATGLSAEELDVSGSLGADNSAWILDGHVKRIRLSGVPIQSLEPLRGLPNLDRVVITGGNLDDLNGLAHQPELTWIQIKDSGLKRLDGLEGCTGLQQLLLRHNRIDSLSGLAELPALTDLDLAHNQLQSIDNLAGRAKLTSLDLSDNHLASSLGIHDLPSLTSLNLARNQLVRVEDLERLPALSKLFLDDNQLQDASVLDRLTSLEIVNLNDNQLQRFPAMVSRLENHLWSGNPGYVTRLASDFEEERARLIEYHIQPELPQYSALKGTWSRGGCLWKGKDPYCSATIPELNGGGQVILAKYEIGALSTDPRRYGITGIVVKLSVEQGRARVYLQRESRVTQTEQGPRTEVGYPYIEATPGDPKSMAGQLFNDGRGIWFMIEGEAKGVHYKLEPGYVP